MKYVDPDGRQSFPSISIPVIVQELEGFGQELLNYGPQFFIASCIVIGIASIADWLNNYNFAKDESSVDARLQSIVLSRSKNCNNNFARIFQVQGSGMYQNIKKGSTQGSKVIQVFSNKPITKKQALITLSILYSELSTKELINMNMLFIEVAEWIEDQKVGFAGAYKSIQLKNNPSGDRIDMIFKGGYNLVPDE